MNEEIELSQAFDLGQPNQDIIFPDNKEPTNTIAMQDALKQYEMNLDFVDVMTKKKESGTLGEIGAGLERFYFGITDIPNNLKNATIRAFNGHIFPNMTEQQATMLMESVTREQMARNQYRQRVEKLEGIDPDNIVSNLTSGIAQAVFYGLTGNVLGGVGMGVSAGLQVAGETSQQYATAYLEKHGSMEGYKGFDDAIYSGLNGAINGYIEQALGVERLFQGTLKKFSIKGARKQLVESFIEEGSEEYLQEVASYTVGKTGDYLSNGSYRETRTFGEMQKDALVNAVYGAIIGGAVGAGLYGVNVSRIARNIQSEYGVDNQTAREMAVDTIEQAKDGVLDEVFTDDSLRNAYGESYDLLKEKVKNTILATNTQVFGENLDDYVNLVSKDIAIQVINNAKAFNIPTKDYLDLANVQSFDNILSLERVDLNDVDVVKDLIKTKKAELKELNLKQKTGIDTKAKRDVLNRQVAQLQVIKQKIDKPVSVEQKQNNPVLTEILGNKFNNINLTPQMIALENVAMSEIINNTPELKTDLKGVIPELQVLNKENFNEIINSSSNNNDIKTNAFLYAMTYGSPEQVKDFFVNYSEKVAVNNGNFTERDLVLQAIEESDIGTAEQKKSVLLSETPSVDNTVEKQLFQERPQQYTQETINIDGVEKPALNSEGNYLGRTEEEIRNFYKWFGDSKVVDEEGKPLVMYHGTREFKFGKELPSFDTFDRNKLRSGQNAVGFYFSENKDFAKNFGTRIMPVYLKIDNPQIYKNGEPTVKELVLEQKEVDNAKSDNTKYLAYKILQDTKKYTDSYDKFVMDIYHKSNLIPYQNRRDGNYNDAVNLGIEKSKEIANNYVNILKSENKDGVIIQNTIIDSNSNKGNRNTQFVVFDSNQIKSVENKGTYSPDTGNIYNQENLLPQNVNGFMDTELKTVVLGSNVNQGTLPHEMAHFFLQKNFDLWKQGNPNAQFDELAQQLGITKEQDYLTRDQQEQFAYMTESYIFGKGLASNVSPTVKAYLNWIPAEYESVINMGYKQADGTEYNPIISDEMKKYFDTAYASLGLSTSPTVKAYTNISDDKDELLASSKEERLVRAKDIQKSIEPEKITMTAQDMAIETKALNKSGETADSWITTIIPGQGTNTREQQQQVAIEWVGKNKEEAKRIAFGNHIQTESDFEQNTAPVDRAFVIREVMKDYSPDSVEYAMLKHKLATYLSLSGKALGLNNDLSFRLYLDNYAKLSNALEQKASFLRYGKSDKSVRLFNADIDKFVATWMDAIVNTKADSQERELAVRNFIESAKQEFETDTVLMQEGIFEQLKKANRKNYNDLAKRYVKQMAGALPSNQNIADLMRLSNRAQALSKNIDSNNTEEAITAGKAIRELQNYIRDKGMPESFMQKLIGGWMPRAMLSSPSTHLTNALSNSIQSVIIKGVNRAYYGKNIVSTQVMNNEKARLKSIYENTGFNLAQQYTINDKALIKGERYETTPNAEAKGWKKYDPMKFLGDSDFFFRNNLYIDTLAHIASKNANGDVKEANRLFNEYKQLATTDEKSLEARQEALLVANIGVFTQNGKFAAILSQIRNSLDLVNIDITKRGVDIGVKGNKGLGTMLAPFIKTPANIIELGARAIASPFTTIYTLAKGEKLSISQAIDLGEATTALLTFAGLCLAGAKYQGTDDPYDRKNDTIQFGDFAIKLDNFGVMAQPLRQAMTLLGSYSGMKVESKDWLNTGISQLPILSEVEKVKLMKDDIGKFINDFTAEQAGKVIPSVIKPITKKAIGYRPDNKYLRKWTQSLGITQSRSAIDDWTEAVSKIAFGSKIQFR